MAAFLERDLPPAVPIVAGDAFLTHPIMAAISPGLITAMAILAAVIEFAVASVLLSLGAVAFTSIGR